MIPLLVGITGLTVAGVLAAMGCMFSSTPSARMFHAALLATCAGGIGYALAAIERLP
jgi:hypothetical protein